MIRYDYFRPSFAIFPTNSGQPASVGICSIAVT